MRREAPALTEMLRDAQRKRPNTTNSSVHASACFTQPASLALLWTADTTRRQGHVVRSSSSYDASSLSLRQSTRVSPSMIRRDPTLIPMTDSDVQDVRDAVKTRVRTEAFARDSGLSIAVPGFAAQEEARKKKEAMSKGERLGL